jgi:hypothetical protein
MRSILTLCLIFIIDIAMANTLLESNNVVDKFTEQRSDEPDQATEQSTESDPLKNSKAEATKKEEKCASTSQYTFSWNLSEICDMQPRGGTSRGTKIVLDEQPHEGWLAIQAENLSWFEKDRRAILAMAGPYRVSFDFLETMGFVNNYIPSKPYQSWGTEYVYVAQDTGDYISLQHIMVMSFVDDDGVSSAPMVMKHWRHDWQYQKPLMFEYPGHNTWKKRTLTPAQTKGKWSQSVYQVDDSPRYESIGAWQHEANVSSWQSAKTWRPLPRRESSVRNNYHVLQGTNKHIILPNGWVQEEHNYKLVLDEQGNVDIAVPFLAKEIGLARYQKIVQHDFSPGDEHWQKSSQFWQDVREVWAQKTQTSDGLMINNRVGGQLMFMPFFAKAQTVVHGEKYDSNKGKQQIREMLIPFIKLSN